MSSYNRHPSTQVAKAEDEADALRLRNKCESRMRDVASVYAAILMRHSNYANLHQVHHADAAGKADTTLMCL